MALPDELAIERTMALYAQRLDDRDVEGYIDLFHADARFISAVSGTHAGRTAIRASIESIYAHQPAERRTEHLFGKSVIVVEGDHAQATTDVVVYERIGSGAWQVFTINRHFDRFIRTASGWLFMEKRIERR
jgi:uncharacterized protein (TIGR02246 family)